MWTLTDGWVPAADLPRLLVALEGLGVQCNQAGIEVVAGRALLGPGTLVAHTEAEKQASARWFTSAPNRPRDGALHWVWSNPEGL